MTKLVTYLKTDKESPFTLLLSDEDIDREGYEAFKRLEKLKNDDDIEEQIEDVEAIQRNLKALKEEGFIETYEGDNSTKEES